MTCICYGHITWNVNWKDTVATHTHWLEMNRMPWQYIILGQQQLKGLELVGGSCSEAGRFRSSTLDGEMVGKCGHFPEAHTRNGNEQGTSPLNAAGTILPDSVLLCLWKGNQCMTERKPPKDEFILKKIILKQIRGEHKYSWIALLNSYRKHQSQTSAFCLVFANVQRWRCASQTFSNQDVLYNLNMYEIIMLVFPTANLMSGQCVWNVALCSWRLREPQHPLVLTEACVHKIVWAAPRIQQTTELHW